MQRSPWNLASKSAYLPHPSGWTWGGFPCILLTERHFSEHSWTSSFAHLAYFSPWEFPSDTIDTWMQFWYILTKLLSRKIAAILNSPLLKRVTVSQYLSILDVKIIFNICCLIGHCYFALLRPILFIYISLTFLLWFHLFVSLVGPLIQVGLGRWSALHL